MSTVQIVPEPPMAFKPSVNVLMHSTTEVIVHGDIMLADWYKNTALLKPGYKYTPHYRKGLWDGYYYPGRYCQQTGNNTFEWRGSRGLLGRLGQHFDFTPLRTTYNYGHTRLNKLRDYQLQALQLAIAHRWGRIALATNAGKGAVMAFLCMFAQQLQKPVLILCHQVAIYDALLEELEEWAQLTPGVVAAGVKTPPTDLVVLARVPTLYKRIKGPTKKTRLEDPDLAKKQEAESKLWRGWLEQKQVVLLDEADLATAPSWVKILANCKNSEWRIGFSGSFPDPKEQPYDDLRLDELTGPVLTTVKNRDLIAREISAKPDVTLHGYDVTSALRAPHKWWEDIGPTVRRTIYDQAIHRNTARHAFIHSLIDPNAPTALVVNLIEHGKSLARIIPEAVFLDGSKSYPKRREILAEFEAGNIPVVIITKILDRGTNRLGHVTDLFFVSGEGSSRETLQRVGRGLRRTGGKASLRLVDIIDRVETEGLGKLRYLKTAAKYLHTAGRKRIQLYRDEGFEVNIQVAL